MSYDRKRSSHEADYQRYDGPSMSPETPPEIPWTNDGGPTWGQLQTIHGWNALTSAADRASTPHAEAMLGYLEDSPPSTWPPGLRGWLEGCLRAGVALALAVHEPPPLDAELRKVAHTFGHVAALSVGMPSRIIDLAARAQTQRRDEAG